MSPLVRDTLAIIPSHTDPSISKARTLSYPKQTLYFIASFIALISLYHFSSILYRFITRNRVCERKKRSTASLRRFPAAALDSFRAFAFRWSVPVGSFHELSLAEVALTLGYMAVLLSWTLANTTTTTGIKVEPHYYANRAGKIAALQLPILVALGMRNNLISCLTGVSFIKLNYFHRITARTLCVLIWIHAGGRITLGLKGDNALVNPWIRSGILAASALTLLGFLSIRPIRQRNYEAFLLVHFILALIFVLGIYFHLRAMSLTYYGALPSMVIWGFEHFIRIIRLATINFGYINPWSSQNSKKKLDATVEVLSPGYMRLTLRRSKYFRWRPGQTAYLSFPSVSMLPFESHPFTISTINDDSSDDNVLVFILRVQSGFTQKLLKKASSSADSDQTYKVFLNGPYGSPPLLIGYQTVILIAGGSGVAFTLPLFLDILGRVRAGKNTCQKILFIWAIRDSDHIRWIANTLAPALDNVPPSISVAVQLYITTAAAVSDLDEPRKYDDDSKENTISSCEAIANNHANDIFTSQPYSTILQSHFVQVHQGTRPDLESVISKQVDEATGRISINVCGPRSLANDTRKAIQLPRPMDVLRGGPTVTLHVEAYGES